MLTCCRYSNRLGLPGGDSDSRLILHSHDEGNVSISYHCLDSILADELRAVITMVVVVMLMVVVMVMAMVMVMLVMTAMIAMVVVVAMRKPLIVTKMLTDRIAELAKATQRMILVKVTCALLRIHVVSMSRSRSFCNKTPVHMLYVTLFGMHASDRTNPNFNNSLQTSVPNAILYSAKINCVLQL